MECVFIKTPGYVTQCFNYCQGENVELLRCHLLLPPSDCYILCNGRLANDNDALLPSNTYHVIPRLPGGKGGFGSMLRAIGAQIEKTTNREACRDLSGRRMRDVNNEKNLKEWVAKAADRKREKEQRKKERLERRLAEPRHNFDDPKYHRQKAQVTEELDSALTEGLKRSAAADSSASAKRKKTSSSTAVKKACEWLGVDVEDLSDLSSSDESGSEAGTSSSACGSSSLVDLGFLPNPDTEAASASASASVSAAVETCSSGSKTEKCEAASNFSRVLQDESQAVEPSSSGDLSISKSEDIVSNVSDMDTDDIDQSVEVVQSTCEASETTGTDQSADVVQSTGETSNCKQGLLSELAELPPPQSEQQEKPDSSTVVIDPTTFDLMEYSSVSALEEQGLDTLKSVLMSRGLKCGGTLQQRAERLWAVRGLNKEEIDSSFFAKPTKGKKKK